VRLNAERIVTLNLGLGRDSIAMLLLLLADALVVDGEERGQEDIDVVVFSNTGAEWPHTYALLPQIRELCESVGLRFIVLEKPPAGAWQPWLHEKMSQGISKLLQPWTQGEWRTIEEKAASGAYHLRPPIIDDYRSRKTVVSISKGDCTDNHKIQPIRKLIADLARERFDVKSNASWGHQVRKGTRPTHLSLIGIAADEASRAEAESEAQYVSEAYPLLEMGITKAGESEILEPWGFDHVFKSGCYHCPYQPPGWYWVVRETLPDFWLELLEYEAAALAENPRMFVTGKKPLADVVETWRAKNPDATIEAVLRKSYKRCGRAA